MVVNIVASNYSTKMKKEKDKMKLEEIAEVMIGILAKRENDEKGENSYSLFSLKSYEEEQKFEELKTNKDLTNKLAKQGDLLFRLLYPNKIIYVDETLEGILIPSQFCIIRAKKEKMDPIVLKWYLESEKVEKELNTIVTGSIIKSMAVGSLKTLDIPNIATKEQENMRQLILLWQREKEILQEILEEKEKLYHFYLEKMIQRGE